MTNAERLEEIVELVSNIKEANYWNPSRALRSSLRSLEKLKASIEAEIKEEVPHAPDH